MPSCLAIFAHPDDVEYFAAGTMLQLAKRVACWIALSSGELVENSPVWGTSE